MCTGWCSSVRSAFIYQIWHRHFHNVIALVCVCVVCLLSMIVSVHFSGYGSSSGIYSSTHISLSITAFILRKPFEAPITLHLLMFLASISHFIYKYSNVWHLEFYCCCCFWLFVLIRSNAHTLTGSFSWQNPFFTCQSHAWCLSKHLNNIPSWGVCVYGVHYTHSTGEWVCFYIFLSICSIALSLARSPAHLIRLFFSPFQVYCLRV